MEKLKVHYLLPITNIRLSSVKGVLEGELKPERYLFYGMDYLKNKRIYVTHNIYKPSVFTHVIGKIYQKLVSPFNIYTTYVEWLLVSWEKLKKADILIVYSDRLMISLLYIFKLKLRPRKPVIYITMGLPEKFQYLSEKVLKCTLDELEKVFRIISLSKPEEEILIEEYGLKNNVTFMPAGVDVKYFKPKITDIKIDVLSIGGDKYRDFKTLINVAKKLNKISFTIITNKRIANEILRTPSNVKILIDVPMNEIRNYLAACRIVCLPVLNNCYSGGTTVMLQAMAMGKPVIATRIRPITEGYGFKNRVNCFLVDPMNDEGFATCINEIIYDKKIEKLIGDAARKHIEDNLRLESFYEKIHQYVLAAINEK